MIVFLSVESVLAPRKHGCVPVLESSRPFPRVHSVSQAWKMLEAWWMVRCAAEMGSGTRYLKSATMVTVWMEMGVATTAQWKWGERQQRSNFLAAHLFAACLETLAVNSHSTARACPSTLARGEQRKKGWRNHLCRPLHQVCVRWGRITVSRRVQVQVLYDQHNG